MTTEHPSFRYIGPENDAEGKWMNPDAGQKPQSFKSAGDPPLVFTLNIIESPLCLSIVTTRNVMFAAECPILSALADPQSRHAANREKSLWGPGILRRRHSQNTPCTPLLPHPLRPTSRSTPAPTHWSARGPLGRDDIYWDDRGTSSANRSGAGMCARLT